jgi:hypothetical protein
MKARIKRNGSIIKDKLAEVFFKIGIAEEIKEDNIKETVNIETNTEVIKSKKTGRPKSIKK